MEFEKGEHEPELALKDALLCILGLVLVLISSIELLFILVAYGT